MKFALFGVGNGGTRITDRILEAESATGRTIADGNVVVFNTDRTASAPEHVPENRQIDIGDIHKETTETGVDGDPDLGVDVAQADLPEIRRALDRISVEELDAVLLVVGLGGGTGCGVGAVILEELKAVYEKPVYVLGVLPAADEPDFRTLNAARAIRSLVPLADNVITFDNEIWLKDGEAAEDGYERVNDELAIRVVNLLAAGEFGTGNESEMKMDPSDIRRTLDTGGLSTIGYATSDRSDDSGGFLAWLRGLFGSGDEETDTETNAVRTNRLIKRTLSQTLTLPCGVESTDRALLILSGPPEEISRKGFESGRYWLEEETDTVEVLAGDEPLPGTTTVTATVLLSNVTNVPRLEAIQERAVAFKRGERGWTFDEEKDQSAEADGQSAEAEEQPSN